MSESVTPTPASTSRTLFDRPMPPGYRDELRALEAEAAANVTRRSGSILLFQLGELRLALPTKVASAVAPVLHIARIPHRSGTVLLGVVAFRGEIIPCCSLSRVLDLPVAGEPSTSASRTLILEESAGRRWAIPIDGVLGVRADVSDDPDLLAPIGLPIASQWVRTSVIEDAGTFYILDSEVLFRQITLATA